MFAKCWVWDVHFNRNIILPTAFSCLSDSLGLHRQMMAPNCAGQSPAACLPRSAAWCWWAVMSEGHIRSDCLCCDVCLPPSPSPQPLAPRSKPFCSWLWLYAPWTYTQPPAHSSITLSWLPDSAACWLDDCVTTSGQHQFSNGYPALQRKWLVGFFNFDLWTFDLAPVPVCLPPSLIAFPLP